MTAASAALVLRAQSGQEPGANLRPAAAEKPAAPVKPPELFTHWPKRQPDVALVFTGQTYSYLQKCGCSDPQKGGLERRLNFIEGLRAKGWEVVPIDLGDVARMTNIPNQALLKYRVAMESMKDIGYKAVGLGKEEVRFGLLTTLSNYSINNPEPKVHAANIVNKADFPSGDGKGSMIHDFDLVPTKSGVGVGVFGLIGKSLVPELEKIDRDVKYSLESGVFLKRAFDGIDAEAKRVNMKSTLRVMLYPGSADREEKAPDGQQPMMLALRDAIRGAEAVKGLDIIVAPSEEAEPPAKPIVVGKTMIVQVGHKGQNVGVVGVFRKDDGTFDLHYERVPIGPEYETPEGQEKDHPILKRLEWYAKEVKAQNFLAAYPKVAHPLKAKVEQLVKQGALPAQAEVRYVGSEACKGCHATEYAAWEKTKHSHAYQALSKIATKPSQRNFDPECIICHTVGFEYQTGYVSVDKTPELKNVGCENCHGPGSLHAAQPNNKLFLAEQSPWKAGDLKAVLPAVEKLKKLAESDPSERGKIITPVEEKVLLRVDSICQKCHDIDNDPKYKFEKYWPHIHHPSPKRGEKAADGAGPVLSKP